MLGNGVWSDLYGARHYAVRKWNIPSYALDEEPPMYLSGGFMLIPKWAISCLATVVYKATIIPADDLFTAGFLAKACNVTRRGVENFFFYYAVHLEPSHTYKNFILYEKELKNRAKSKQ